MAQCKSTVFILMLGCPARLIKPWSKHFLQSVGVGSFPQNNLFDNPTRHRLSNEEIFNSLSNSVNATRLISHNVREISYKLRSADMALPGMPCVSIVTKSVPINPFVDSPGSASCTPSTCRGPGHSTHQSTVIRQ